MKFGKLTNCSNRFSIRVAAFAAMLGLMAAAGTVQAGYYTIHGVYVPTCVPGYWMQGPMGPFWVSGFCR